MTLVRRFLLVMALLFWQGGFLFYASVVVPVAQEPVGQEKTAHLRQGFITRRVTNYLNLSGAIALAVVGLDLLAVDPRPFRRIARAVLWLGMAVALAWLAWSHTSLDSLLDPDNLRVLDRSAFYTEHRTYLWISTAQWVFGLAFLWLTLDAWRAVDRNEIAFDSRRKGRKAAETAEVKG